MSSRPPLLALDPATRYGHALFLPGDTLPVVGARQLPSSPVDRILQAEELLCRLLVPVAWGQGEVAYETPLGNRGWNAKRVACHLEAVLLRCCAAMGVTVLCPYRPQDAKAAVTGKSRASKEEVAAGLRARGLEVKQGDAADAAAVLYAHMVERGYA